jgi:hypothetical protein
MRHRIEEGHPLLSLRPEPIESWAAWKSLWESARYMPQYLGLLHCGFTVPADPHGGQKWRDAEIDRLCFYLDLADGHADGEHYFITRGSGIHHPDKLAQMRAELAKKAFSVLAKDFFNNTEAHHTLPSWMPLAVEAQALEKLVWFLLNRNNTSEYSKSKADCERAIQFAIELCKFGWRRDNSRLRDDDGRVKRLEVTRPDFVEILFVIGQGNMLLNRSNYPLDDPSWKRLEQLALEERQIRVPNQHGSFGYETREPKTIEEALANGSWPAQVFHTLRAVQQEDQRFQEAVTAMRDLRDAERRLERVHQTQ